MLGSTGDGKTFFSADRQEGELYLLEVEELGPPPAVEDYGQTIQALWDRRGIRVDGEGGSFLRMEGTQPGEIAAPPPQLNIPADTWAGGPGSTWWSGA